MFACKNDFCQLPKEKTIRELNLIGLITMNIKLGHRKLPLIFITGSLIPRGKNYTFREDCNYIKFRP